MNFARAQADSLFILVIASSSDQPSCARIGPFVSVRGGHLTDVPIWLPKFCAGGEAS